MASSKKARFKHTVQVNAYSTSWLSKGFDWVYAKEIVKQDPRLVAGDVVRILSSDNKLLGKGIYSTGRVAVRRFHSHEAAIDDAFLRMRVMQALQARPRFTDDQAWRLIHGENDCLPGVRIDMWGKVASITLACSSLRRLFAPLCRVLQDVLSVQQVWGHIRDEEHEVVGLLHGMQTEEQLWVQEHGLRYRAQPDVSPDAGLFCDMRPLRKWLQPYWGGKKVLNLFCFSGAFSVSAAAGQASEVVSVDLSSSYVEWVKENFVANELPLESHRFIAADAMKSLDRFRRKGESFDIIIADPPSFSHGPQGQWSVERQLSGLVASCLRVLRKNGWLVIATNYGKMSPREFTKAIRNAGNRVGKIPRIIHIHHPPIDFPASLAFPESRYLKCWVLQG